MTQRRISTYFLSCNRNKQSVVLDLKSDDSRAALTELVRRSDVLLENFRPGVLDRLGFTMERLTELNPALVVLSISGFGHDGPEGGRAGYEREVGAHHGQAGDPDLGGCGVFRRAHRQPFVVWLWHGGFDATRQRASAVRSATAPRVRWSAR